MSKDHSWSYVPKKPIEKPISVINIPPSPSYFLVLTERQFFLSEDCLQHFFNSPLLTTMTCLWIFFVGSGFGEGLNGVVAFTVIG